MYKVIKGYCGIKKGTKTNSNDPTTIKHMLKEGYWEKIEPEVKRRKKKVIDNAPKNK